MRAVPGLGFIRKTGLPKKERDPESERGARRGTDERRTRMAKARLNVKLVAGCVLLLGSAGPALAQQVTVDQLLQYRPIQSGVVYTIPTAEEKALCKVQVYRGPRQGSTGYLLLDAKGQPLRRFFDSNG